MHTSTFFSILLTTFGALKHTQAIPLYVPAARDGAAYMIQSEVSSITQAAKVDSEDAAVTIASSVSPREARLMPAYAPNNAEAVGHPWGGLPDLASAGAWSAPHGGPPPWAHGPGAWSAATWPSDAPWPTATWPAEAAQSGPSEWSQAATSTILANAGAAPSTSPFQTTPSSAAGSESTETSFITTLSILTIAPTTTDLVSATPESTTPAVPATTVIPTSDAATSFTTTTSELTSATSTPIDTPTIIATSTLSSTVTIVPTTTPTALPWGFPDNQLAINLVNKLGKNNVKAYLTGQDQNGQLIMLDQDGSWFYPSTTSSTPEPVPSNVELTLGGGNSTLNLKTPGYIRSARLWISEGPLNFYVVATPSGAGLVQPSVANAYDPNYGSNYGFVEFDWEPYTGLYADITAVDFVGLPLGMELVDKNGNVFSALGLNSDAAPVLCDMLKKKADESGQPWDKLCVHEVNKDPVTGATTQGELIRVISPGNLMAQDNTHFAGIFDDYTNHVWDHYKTNDLIINTATGAGNVTCRVVKDSLKCAGDNRVYNKPTSADIFGCNSGPFSILEGDNYIHLAVVPRLCAAFNRATLLLPGGGQQPGPPVSSFYSDASWPNNVYSAYTHMIEAQGRGYAFAYDDVQLSDLDSTAGLIASGEPEMITVYVGGA